MFNVSEVHQAASRDRISMCVIIFKYLRSRTVESYFNRLFFETSLKIIPVFFEHAVFVLFSVYSCRLKQLT